MLWSCVFGWENSHGGKRPHCFQLLSRARSVDQMRTIMYGIVGHPHNDQFDRDDKEMKRKPEPPNGKADDVPKNIEVPVSRNLYEVLHEMDPVRFPGPPSSEDVDHASIEDILGRLPEAFEAQGLLSEEGLGPPMNTTQGPFFPPSSLPSRIQRWAASARTSESTAPPASGTFSVICI